MAKKIWHGIAAGAAGTTALNLITYLDMALRGRPESTTPEQTVRKAEQATHLQLSADGPDSDTASNRRSGLGALLGIASGLGSGLAYGLVRPHQRWIPLPLAGMAAGLAANAATTVPMAASGVSDPRSWSASAWLSDLVPHLAYGLATATVFEALDSWRPARPLRTGLCGAVKAALKRTDGFGGRTSRWPWWSGWSAG